MPNGISGTRYLTAAVPPPRHRSLRQDLVCQQQQHQTNPLQSPTISPLHATYHPLCGCGAAPVHFLGATHKKQHTTLYIRKPGKKIPIAKEGRRNSKSLQPTLPLLSHISTANNIKSPHHTDITPVYVTASLDELMMPHRGEAAPVLSVVIFHPLRTRFAVLKL